MLLALAFVALCAHPAQDPPPDEVALLEGRVLLEKPDGVRVPLAKGALLVEFPDVEGVQSIDVRDGRFALPHDRLDVVLEVVSVYVSGGRARLPGGRAELHFLDGAPTLVAFALPSRGEERLDELYLMEGTILLDDGPGAPIPVKRGVLRFRVDGEESTREADVVDGRFEFVESRTDFLYHAESVELGDGRFGAFYEGSFPFHFEEGTPRVLAQPVRATSVTARDAGTGEALLGVGFEVRDPQRDRPERARDPLKTTPVLATAEGRLVPVDPRTTRYRVRVAGYAPIWIDVDPFAGGARDVELAPAGTALLQYRGPRASDSWDVLRVRSADGALLYEGPFVTRMSDLPAGELRFRLEGRRLENPFVWGEGQGTVPAGGESTIEVTAVASPRYEPATLAGRLVVPRGWNVEGETFTLLGDEEVRLRLRHDLGPEQLDWIVSEAGKREAAFRFEELAPGGHRVEFGDLRARVVVPPWGDESARLVLPELARVTIRVVEGGTGRPVDGGTVTAGLTPAAGTSWYRIDVPALRVGPGEFLLHAPAGLTTMVDVRPEGFRRLQVARTFAAGDQHEVMEVVPRMGVTFEVIGHPEETRAPALGFSFESGPPDGELLWPRTARNAVEVSVPGHYTFRAHASGYEEVRVEVEVGRDELVVYELRLEPRD